MLLIKIQIIWARGQVTVTQSPDEKVYITEKAFVMPKATEVVGVSVKNDTLLIKDYNSLLVCLYKIVWI